MVSDSVSPFMRAPRRRPPRRPELPADQSAPIQDFFAGEIEQSKTNWRPLVSYTSNLSRVGRQLLGDMNNPETLSGFAPGADLARISNPVYREIGPWVGLF